MGHVASRGDAKRILSGEDKTPDPQRGSPLITEAAQAKEQHKNPATNDHKLTKGS